MKGLILVLTTLILLSPLLPILPVIVLRTAVRRLKLRVLTLSQIDTVILVPTKTSLVGPTEITKADSEEAIKSAATTVKLLSMVVIPPISKPIGQ